MRYCSHCGQSTVDMMSLPKRKLSRMIGKLLDMKPEGQDVTGKDYWMITGLPKKIMLEMIVAIQKLKGKEVKDGDNM